MLRYLTRPALPKCQLKITNRHSGMVPFFHIIATFAFKADIRADTNRVGFVDIIGDSDFLRKTTWTKERGAIFLPNIGDTDRRCSKLTLHASPSNEELAKCHDSSDDIQRSPQFLAPLLTMPMQGLQDAAVGSISVPDPYQRPFVRIFHQHGDDWAIVRNDTIFQAPELRNGLVLGIDGRDTRRPGVWDGRAMVCFTIRNGEEISSDEVMLRVAPVLTHHHLDRVEQVLSVAGNDSKTPWQRRWADKLTTIVQQSGLNKPVLLFEGDDDIWAQDFVEPGYASMPGPNGPISIRIMVRSSQDDRTAGRQVFKYLRDTGVGAVQHLGGARDEINSMGNLECIPPFTHNGISYPSGRIIMGRHGSYKPHILDYLRAQEVQDPVLLDTAWLWVGHVDEFIQFFPTKSERGWIIMVADPQAGLDLLQHAQSSGYGASPMYSRKSDPQTPGVDCDDSIEGCRSIPVPDRTIDQFLSNGNATSTNTKCKERIEANIDILKQVTGITDCEIHRIPSLFEQADLDSFPILGPRAPGEKLAAIATYPGVINGVVLTGYGTYLAPNPWGPIVEGHDIFAEAARRIYAELGFNVKFIDNWNTHHNYGGEVHCGTNTVRQIDRPWW